MAREILLLPLSGRLNVIKWLESFRNSGNGLNQDALNIFDTGNNYTNNAKINFFNRKVKIIIDALEINGIEIKKTPKGRYSLTLKTLSKLTLDKFTKKLSDFVFDENIADIDFRDKKNIVPLLNKLYKEGKIDGFKSLHIFKAFASYGNIPALEWLVKKYGIKNYDITQNTNLMFFLTEFKNFESELIDFYINSGILKEGFDLMENLTLFNEITNLSEEGIKKVLKLIKLEPGDEFCFNYLYNYYKTDPKLLNYFSFDKNDWDILAQSTITYIGNDYRLFNTYKSYLEYLIKTSNIFFESIILKKWKFSDDIINFVPSVKDIFFF